MNPIRAVVAAFGQQWKMTVTSIVSLSFLLMAVPVVAVLAWIAYRSDDPVVLTY